MKEFLFNYRWDGAEWGITIFARDEYEAQQKIKAVSLARYEGELYMRIPARASLFGLLPRVIVWLRQRQWLLLTGAGIIVAGVLALWATWPQEKDCPPEWQCRGPAETNHPRCNCWDAR